MEGHDQETGRAGRDGLPALAAIPGMGARKLEAYAAAILEVNEGVTPPA